MKIIVIASLALLLGAGCKKDEPTPTEQAAAAVAAAATAAQAANQAAAQSAQAAAQAGQAAAQAGQAAGAAGQGAGQAAANNPLAALANLAKAGQAMAGGGKTLGKVVNWRKLAPFVPEKLGDFVGQGELNGSTESMGGMQVSKVGRHYQAGERRLDVEIVDTSLVPMMRAGFAMAQMMNKDSTSGVQRGTTVDGQPGVLEWRKRGQRGKVSILAGGRFVVNVKLRPTDDPKEVEALAKGLGLQKLAAVKADE